MTQINYVVLLFNSVHLLFNSVLLLFNYILLLFNSVHLLSSSVHLLFNSVLLVYNQCGFFLVLGRTPGAHSREVLHRSRVLEMQLPHEAVTLVQGAGCRVVGIGVLRLGFLSTIFNTPSPGPQTLHPELLLLCKPASYTTNPEFSTLNPTPQALDPRP